MTEELKLAMLTPLVKRVFELEKEYNDTHYFGITEEDKINYIVKNL